MGHKMNIPVILLIFACILTIECCKKPQTSITGGGTGGNGIIAVTPEHYGSLLDSCTVYIKYGSLNAPANGQYDDSILPPLPLVDDTVPVAVFRNLTPGLYYIYAAGYHPAFSSRVKGAIPVTKNTADSNHVFAITGDY